MNRTVTTTTILPGLAAALTIGGCASIPPDYPPLAQARSEYRIAAADPQVARLAPLKLEQAEATLRRAEALQREGDDAAALDHQAYLAMQRARIARETAALRAAERTIDTTGAEREKVLLAARTREAQAANREASEQAHTAAIALEAASAARARSATLEARARMLEAELDDVKARQTERGYVVTLAADVLFDVGEADLKPGAERAMTKLAEFLSANPGRDISVEGFTDSTGADTFNQALSERRAQAVANALMARGISASRIETRGYGEAYPVATNDTPAGRQLNRRVEVVLSEVGRTVLIRR
jgi:outer membrane protein OmpA-like peptidoglycan-associated protein